MINQYLDKNGLTYFWTKIKNYVDTNTGYTLPIASSSTLGGIRIGNGLDVSGDGTVSVNVSELNIPNQYVLPVATASVLGGIKIGQGLQITPDGVVSVNTSSLPLPDEYELPVATSSRLGGVKIGQGINVGVDGAISVDTESLPLPDTYELPVASSTVLGGVKIGNGIDVTKDGTISVNKEELNIPEQIVVEDNLTSDSPTNALSAKQGKYLKQLIDNIDTGGGTGTPSFGQIKDCLIELGVARADSNVDLFFGINLLYSKVTSSTDFGQSERKPITYTNGFRPNANNCIYDCRNVYSTRRIYNYPLESYVGYCTRNAVMIKEDNDTKVTGNIYFANRLGVVNVNDITYLNSAKVVLTNNQYSNGAEAIESTDEIISLIQADTFYSYEFNVNSNKVELLMSISGDFYIVKGISALLNIFNR